MAYSRILYIYVRCEEFKITSYRRKYITSHEVVDCIPMNWNFFHKKCSDAYTCT